MKKKTRGQKKETDKEPAAVAPGTADLSKFIDDMVAEDAVGSEKLDTKESVNSFVDSMVSLSTDTAKEKKDGIKQKAREKSKGATGGMSKSLDYAIKNLTNIEKQNKEGIAENKRDIEENHQAIQRQATSITMLQHQMQDLSRKTARALGMLSEMNKKLDALKDYIDEKVQKLPEEEDKKSWGDILDAKVGAGLKKVGRAAGRGLKAAPGFLRAAAGPAALGATAAALYNMRQETLESDLGTAYEKGDLNKIKNQAIRQGQTGMRATDAELKSVIDGGPELAKDILERGGRDVELYGGRQNLEKLAAGEKLSVEELKKGTEDVGVKAVQKKIKEAKELGPAKGPQESTAVKAARAETGAGSAGGAPAGGGAASGKNATPTGAPGAGGLGNTSMDTSNATGVGETATATKAMQLLSAKGWNQEQAAGIVGNLQAESGPDMKTNAVGDGGKAYGIAQWHPDRQDRFKKQYKKDIREAGFEEQLDFLDWEIKNVELQAYRALKEAKNAREAAIAFDQYYERSSGAHRAQRIANAEAIMKTAKGSTDQTSNPTPTSAPEGSMPDAVPSTQEKGVAAPGAAPLKNPGAGEAKDQSQGYKPSAGEGSMPPNVRLGSGVNISAVDKDLLSKFFSAAAEYGKPVTIESAARDDKKQAELWVRGRILKEPGIYMPAAPRTPQRITYNGKEYDVPGGGSGSSHADGQALDVPQAPQMAGLLQKYGLTIPFGGSDPVHIQKIGYTPTGGGSPGAMGGGQSAPRGRMGGEGSSMPQTASRGIDSILSASTGRGSSMPSGMGAAAMTPGMGPLAGILSTLAVGGARSMVPQNPMGIMGLVGSLLNTLSPQNRGNNPQFNSDSFKDNTVPAAMPSASILKEVFGMEIEKAYRP